MWDVRNHRKYKSIQPRSRGQLIINCWYICFASELHLTWLHWQEACWRCVYIKTPLYSRNGMCFTQSTAELGLTIHLIPPQRLIIYTSIIVSFIIIHIHKYSSIYKGRIYVWCQMQRSHDGAYVPQRPPPQSIQVWTRKISQLHLNIAFPPGGFESSRGWVGGFHPYSGIRQACSWGLGIHGGDRHPDESLIERKYKLWTNQCLMYWQVDWRVLGSVQCQILILILDQTGEVPPAILSIIAFVIKPWRCQTNVFVCLFLGFTF